MRNFEVKRGAALQLTVTMANADGTAFNLSTITVTGQVRDAQGNLVAELSVQPVTGTPGAGTITVPDTTAWPIGLLMADLYVTDNVLPAITRTFGINVVASVTYTDPAAAPFDPVTS